MTKKHFTNTFIILFLFLLYSSVKGQTYHSQFSVSGGPHHMSFSSDGHLLISTSSGELKKYTKEGVLVPTNFYKQGGADGTVTNTNGRLYIANFSNQIFGSGGNEANYTTYLNSGPNSSKTAGLAIDPSNNDLYIVDYGNKRIQVISNGGATRFLSEGLLVEPMSIFLNGNDIYVTDKFEVKRINKLTGEITKSYGTTPYPNASLAQTLFTTVTMAKNILYFSNGQNRIVKYSLDGTLIGSFGSPNGTASNANGEFNRPIGVLVDTDGTIYVSDHGNNRIQVFKDNICNFNEGYDGKFAVSDAYGIDVAYNGNIYVGSGNTIKIYDNTYNLISSISSSSLTHINDLVVDNDLNVFVTDLIGGSEDYEIIKFNNAGTIVGTYTNNKTLYGITLDKYGYVYVGNQGNNVVLKLNSSLTSVISIIGQGVVDGNKTFGAPYDIAVDNNENIFVSTGYGDIWKFNKNGTLIKRFGENTNMNPPNLSYSKGLALDGANNLFVADHYNYRIVKYSNDGVYITSFQPTGYALINSVAIDKNCNLWAVDGNYVHRWSKNNTNLERKGDVDEILTIETLSIYPNPSQGQFNVILPKQAAYIISLTNSQGIEVKSESFEGNEWSVSEDHLSPGLYIVHASCNGVTYKSKVTINK